jgi:hypothetical protein
MADTAAPRALGALAEGLRLVLAGDRARLELTSILVGAVLLAVLSVAVVVLPVPAQLGLIAGVVGVAFFFLRPADALLLFFLGRVLVDLAWWIPGRIGSLNLMELYTGGITALMAVLFLLDFRRHEEHPALAPFVPYVVVLVFGGIRNLEVRSAAEIMARYLSPLLMMFMITAYMDTRERRQRLVKLLLITFAIPVLISLYKLASGQMNTYVLAGYRRLRGGYKNLHSHALTMLVISALCLWHLLRAWDAGRRRDTLVIGALTAGAGLCLYLTYVRTALLALIVCGGVFLAVTGRRRILAMGLVFALVAVLFSETLQDRFKDLVLFFLPNDNVMARRKLGSGRMAIWTAAITAYLQSSPGDILMGLGIGKHWLLTRGAFNPYAIASGGYVDPHSDYLTMTFQVGPIATASYVFMQFTAARAGLLVYRHSPDRWARSFGAFTVALMAGASLANGVSNAFINRITVAWLLWGMCGLTFAEYLQLRREGRLASEPTVGRRLRPVVSRLRGGR